MVRIGPLPSGKRQLRVAPTDKLGSSRSAHQSRRQQQPTNAGASEAVGVSSGEADCLPSSANHSSRRKSVAGYPPYPVLAFPDHGRAMGDSVVEPESTESLRRRRPQRRALIWFRRDLRLHDNLALQGAIRAATGRSDSMELLPIYIIHKPVRKRCGAVRFQFLLESLRDLHESLTRSRSRLLVLRGEAVEVLRIVLPAWGITDLFFEQFVMPYAIERDDKVREMAAQLGVNVTSFRGVTLFDPREVIAKNGGNVPTKFEELQNIVQNMTQPAQPLPTPTSLPHDMTLSSKDLFELLCDYCRSIRLLDDVTAQRIAGVYAGGQSAGDKEGTALFAVPELRDFGHETPTEHSFLFGGETQALRLLDEFCKDEKRVGLFQKPYTSPASADRPSTTSLSAYLSFGCLSPREFFYRVMFIQLKFPGQKGPPETTLDGQLLWREFFYCFCSGVPNFDTQDQNPMCKQIAWRLPYEPSLDNGTVLDSDTVLAIEQLQKWKDGRTGFPWIDAVMRQIKREGWAHHIGRHAVAVFLTRGDLYISWLRGAAYFQEHLIDLDWPINIGNWLWVSSSCFFRDYTSIHSPSLYPQRWDPEGRYIRKYVPELRDLPTRFVFEPWRAPLRVQNESGCLIGKHYPFPMVDHRNASRKCVAGVRKAHDRVDGQSDGEQDAYSVNVDGKRRP